MDFFEVGDEFVLTEILHLLGEHFAVADDGVHRRAQLVAHVGEEGALCAVGLLGLIARFGQFGGAQAHFLVHRLDHLAQLAGHAVEVAGQIADFIAAAHFGAAVQVTRGDFVRGGGEFLDGTRERARHHPRGERGEEAADQSDADGQFAQERDRGEGFVVIDLHHHAPTQCG